MSQQKPHRHEKMTAEEARIWARLTDAEYQAEIVAAGRTPTKKQPQGCTGDCRAGTCAYCGRLASQQQQQQLASGLSQRVNASTAGGGAAAAPPVKVTKPTQAVAAAESSNFFVTNWKLTLLLAFIAYIYFRFFL